MTIIIYMPDFDKNSIQGNIVREWILEKIRDKSTENLSPLRYASGAEFTQG